MNSTNERAEQRETSSPKAKYLSLTFAAQKLNSTPEELLHFGATGQLIVLGAIAEGIFQLDIAVELEALPEFQAAPQTFFDLSDRVVLAPFDLAKIEAIGWAIPETVYSFERAKSLAEANASLLNTKPFSAVHAWPSDPNPVEPAAPSQFEVDQRKADEDTYINSEVIRDLAARFPVNWEDARRQFAELRAERLAHGAAPESVAAFADARNKTNAKLRAFGLRAPWRAVTPLEERSVRTTIDQLFVSTAEIARVQTGLPLPEAEQQALRSLSSEHSSHGNADYYAQLREEILAAAIYCMHTHSTPLKTATELAKAVCQAAVRIWPSTGAPPLSESTIVLIVREAFKGKCHRPSKQKEKKR